MSILFAQILNMSLTASVVILCVMAARLLLKKAPKIFSYALWAVVLFRLLCPVSLTAPVSVLEVTSPRVTNTEGVSSVYYEPVESALEESGLERAPVRQESISIQELEQRQEDTAPSIMELASWLWLAGMAVMLLHSMVTYLRLYRNLAGAMRWQGNVYLADRIGSPFVLGVLFPKIYLPSDTPMAERRCILAHERHHIRRGDHILKLLAYAALCIHWFNPLVWAAFILAGKDMEMSCDEAVIQKLGDHVRADYAASLLRLATHRRVISGTPLAFGEGDTKGRVMNMAKWKKPKVWVSILCLVLCILLVAVCALNPQEDTREGEDSPIRIGQLPEGYAWKYDDDRNILFTHGRDIVGGVTSYAIPKGVYDPEDEVFNWLEDVGIPDYEDSSLIYQGGMTFSDDQWSAEFASDVPEGTEPSVQRHHNFSVVGDRVFDCWVDLLQVEWDIYMDIRDAVKITDNTEPTETEALYKCHAVLKAVQSGSSHISLERCYDADTFPGDYTQEYLQHQNRDHDEWLSFITVQIAGTTETHADLYADGTYFSNMGKWSEEEMLWTEMMTESDPLRPWLTTFQWNRETVAYMGTLSDGSGECVMLRIDEPFVMGTEETEGHYFVNFHFDSQGSFVKVKITVDPNMEEEFFQTESIVTLENLRVYNKINHEYRNATGKSLMD